MGGSASSSPAVQRSLENFMDAMSGGLNSQPALDQYSKQFRNMPDAAIRGVGDAVASIPDMAIAAGKLAMEGGFNPRMGQSERVKRFADTTYMPINPMMQDALTRAGVAETEGGNNLTRFVSGAMAPYAMGKYAGAVGDAIGAAERGAASRLRDAAMGPGDRYIYHTSPEKISAINSIGLFDDGLHFSNNPYFMTAVKNPTTYKMKINDADYINAQQIPYHDDYSKIDDVVKEIANRYDVSDDVALDLISENKSVYSIDGIENYGDAAWDIQRAGLNAAKRLGYKGLIGNDEQGATYLTSMLGREKDLVDVAAERGALSNAERGMVKLTDDLPMDEASRIVTYRGSDLHPDILNAIKPIVGKKQRSQELSNIKKMQIPIEEMEAKRRLLPKRDLPVFDVNNIPTGSWLLGSPADAMKGAAELTEINGLKLKAPVRLDGGIDYAQMHKSPGWASEESAGTAWKNSVNNQLAEGKDIWPAIVAMSARGTTSTKAMANLQTQRLANIEIPRRSADAMTKMLRQYKQSVKTKDGYRVTFPFKDAPSFRNQNEMAKYIDGLELTQRGRFFEALDRAKTLDKGVPNLIPDLASARFALADENQLGIPAGSSGMLITRMNRPMTMAEVLKGQEGYHPGYRYRQSGFDVAGKTDVSIPPQVFWKDAFQKIIDRGRSPEEAAVVLPRPKGGGPLLQEVTNEWKDLVSKVIEDNKKSGSGRNALLPLGAGGAGAISVDYDEEERKLKKDRKRK